MALSYGSRGDDVKKLQQALNSSGNYNLAVDGIYGEQTQNAVRDYQTNNGLNADGIAGDDLTSKLYDNKQQTPSAESAQPSQPATQQKPNVYDANADAAYQEALAALQQAQKTLPTYQGTYDQQLQDIYNQIVNRDKFSYDLNGDMLYQQYADQYAQKGKMAMMDTMGQAAALTGGYGSSYGQAVGQQQYDAYLQQLNDVVPELYGLALDQYNQEGQNLLNQYAMVGDMADDEYGKYQDALNQYWQNLSYLKGQADDAYTKGFNEDAVAYDRQQDAYSKLVALITGTGYIPTAEELAAAGMNQAEADAYMKLYKGGSGGGGGLYYTGDDGADDGETDNTGYKKAEIRKVQQFLGTTANGVWGQESAEAARNQGYDSFEAALVAYRHMMEERGTGNGNAGSVNYGSDEYSYDDLASLIPQIGSKEAAANMIKEVWEANVGMTRAEHAHLLGLLREYYG